MVQTSNALLIATVAISAASSAYADPINTDMTDAREISPELEARIFRKILSGGAKLLGFGREDGLDFEARELSPELEARLLPLLFGGAKILSAVASSRQKRDELFDFEARELNPELEARIFRKILSGGAKLLGFGREDGLDFQARELSPELEARLLPLLFGGAKILSAVASSRQKRDELFDFEARELNPELEARIFRKILSGGAKLLGFGREDELDFQARELSPELEARLLPLLFGGAKILSAVASSRQKRGELFDEAEFVGRDFDDALEFRSYSEFDELD